MDEISYIVFISSDSLFTMTDLQNENVFSSSHLQRKEGEEMRERMCRVPRKGEEICEERHANILK